MSGLEGHTRVLFAGTDARLRLHLRRLLAAFPDIAVVGHARPGMALSEVAGRAEADVLLLDVTEEPAAATQLLAEARRAGLRPVVLAGGLPFADGGRTVQIQRPADLQDEPFRSPFGTALAIALRGKPAVMAAAAIAAAPAALAAPAAAIVRAAAAAPLLTRPAAMLRPEIIAIGSSTGGPQALPEVLSGLAAPGRRPRLPIVVTQHMPAAFTSMLADHLARRTGMPAVEATDGMRLEAGRIHLAPGGRHLLLAREGAQVLCQLDDGPPENFCKPAVDPMLRSVLQVYGGRVLVVILTGMGHDGLAGCRALVEAGATLLAQDEASSVVWGMPGAVATAGLCHQVLPLDRISQGMLVLMGGG